MMCQEFPFLIQSLELSEPQNSLNINIHFARIVFASGISEDILSFGVYGTLEMDSNQRTFICEMERFV